MGPDVRPVVAERMPARRSRCRLDAVSSRPWVMVRTPLLPVSRLAWVRQPTEALADPEVVRALAIGSPTLLDKALGPDPDPKEAGRTNASLARYLIRMSTRPTPYGAFAAVSLATEWRGHRHLPVGSATHPNPPRHGLASRTARRSGARPLVRSRLRWRADPLAAESGDRLVAPTGGSVRATEPARLALAAAASWTDRP